MSNPYEIVSYYTLFTPPPPPGGHGTSQHLPTTRNFGRLGCKSFDWYLDNVATEVGLIVSTKSDTLASVKHASLGITSRHLDSKVHPHLFAAVGTSMACTVPE